MPPKLIVGIGNPGSRYARTRHNVGWMIVDLLAERWALPAARERFEGWCLEGRIGGEAVVLLKPTTFVNESGRSVAQAAAWYGLAPAEEGAAWPVLVCCDDVHLPLGQLRIRRKGSSGGHRGLASVAAALGSERFPRLRVGIGPETLPSRVDHVLGRFRRGEWPSMREALARAAEAAGVWVTEGIERAMNAFN